MPETERDCRFCRHVHYTTARITQTLRVGRDLGLWPSKDAVVYDGTLKDITFDFGLVCPEFSRFVDD